MVKVTFTFDEHTVETLKRAAFRLKKPQSAVVREAIQDYARRSQLLDEEERRRLLKVLDRMVARGPSRSTRAVNAEIAQVRAARKTGGRRSRSE
jgi:hypothetical protein